MMTNIGNNFTPETILLTQKQVAKLLGTTVGVLNTWRSQGRNPIPFIRWGNRIRYRREDVDRWMMENMIIPTK